MTDEELARIEALANAATPGKWQANAMHWGQADVTTPDAAGDIGINGVRHSRIVDLTTFQNAFFIAAARDAVPALVAEVKRLRRIESLARDVLDDDSASVRGYSVRLLEAALDGET
jgi:hypothetical protein